MVVNFYGEIVRKPENFFIILFGNKDHPFPTIRAEAYVIPSEGSRLCADKNLQLGLEKILGIREGNTCTVFLMNEKSFYHKIEEVKVEFGYSTSVLFSRNVRKEGLQIIGISRYDPGIITSLIEQGVLYGRIQGVGWLKYS